MDPDDTIRYGNLSFWLSGHNQNVVQCRYLGQRYTLGRLLLGVTDLKYDVDHINKNILDNRRANLRLVTKQQNQHNTYKRSGTASKYKGVAWLTSRHKWAAQMKVGGKHIHLGCFFSEEDAARAYDTKARELHKEYGRYNFPLPHELPAL